MNTSAPIVGLFGSSHISHYPLDIFHTYNIHPIVISSSPENIAAIIRQNTVHHTIKYIQSHNITLDRILILIGANDIGTLTPTQIVQGIIHIANSFNNIKHKTHYSSHLQQTQTQQHIQNTIQHRQKQNQ